MTIAMRGGPSSGTESPQDNSIQIQNISSLTQGNQVSKIFFSIVNYGGGLF